MSKIIIFDVPASSGGALTVLNTYYNKALNDMNNEYIFVVGLAKLEEAKNISIIKYPWIKKSWFHRLYFDLIVASKIIDAEKPDLIISLQNTYIRNKKKINQTIYMHQALPFIEKKMSFFKEPKLWVYQNIIGSVIRKSLVKSDRVLVQTEWIKNAIINQLNIDSNKINIEKFNIEINDHYYNKSNSVNNIFFYPASGERYKNHDIVVKAVKELVMIRSDFKVEFTLTGNENRHIRKLSKIIRKNKLPIDLIGKINYDQMFQKYINSTLLFPSYIETLGLPLLEAMYVGSTVIASDTLFSREALNEYDNVYYFKHSDDAKLTSILNEILDRSLPKTESAENYE